MSVIRYRVNRYLPKQLMTTQCNQTKASSHSTPRRTYRIRWMDLERNTKASQGWRSSSLQLSAGSKSTKALAAFQASDFYVGIEWI